MALLTIALADMRRLCGFVIGDTTADADFSALIAAEQPVYEYPLDPAKVSTLGTDAGLSATLTLGVTEILASRYLLEQARAPGALDDFKVGPIAVTASKTTSAVVLAQQLAQHGALLLQPFSKAGLLALSSATAAGSKPGFLPVADILPSVSSTADTGSVTGSLSGSLFGALQGAALGTDDAEPPAEFTAGYTSLSDPNSLGGS